MAGAGQVELFVERIGNASFNPQQHAIGQRRIWLRQEAIEDCCAAGAKGIEQLQIAGTLIWSS